MLCCAFSLPALSAGIALNKALRSRFGASPPACYKKFAEVFSDDSCWQIIPPSTPGGQMLAQLNLPLLLHEAAALQDATAGIPFKHNSNSSSSHCSAVRAASSAADAPAAAARAGSAAAVLRLAGDAADGASSSQQAAGWPAVHGASTSTAHATRGVQQVSAGTLLQHVSSRVWHSNLQLDLARRALAQHLVAKANEGVEAHCPANSDVELYRERFAQAGKPNVELRQACNERLPRGGDCCHAACWARTCKHTGTLQLVMDRASGCGVACGCRWGQ